MEDKLVRLSILNEKSSNLKPNCICGNTSERELRIQQCIKNRNLNKINDVSNNKSIPSSSILIKDLPNNPYCSAITGKYVFDLNQISNFNVYFWTSTDNPTNPTTLNPAIEDELAYYPTFAVNWSADQKTQVKKSLDAYTTFTSTTSTVINDYSNCDIVCVLLDNSDSYFG